MTDDDKQMAAAKALTGAAQEIAAGLNRSYTEEELKRGLSTRCVHELIGDVVAVANAKFKELSARIEALESGGIKFCGNYQRAQAYRRGFVTTHKGSMWTALVDVPEGIEPGSSPAHWQLSQKTTTRVKAEGRKV